MKRPSQLSDFTGSRRVGRNVRLLRKARHLSVLDLVALCRAKADYPMTRFAVYAVENGYNRGARATPRSVSVEELVALACALDVAAAHLLTEPDCAVCNGAPPQGFVCGTCGAGTPATAPEGTDR